MINERSMFNFVQENPNLVSCKKQSNGLYVLKYKNRVFYKNLWTPELLECRGTVVDMVDDRLIIVQRPFTKIFNLGERGTKLHRDEWVYVSRKVNGFMGALTHHNGVPLVSTTGSCDSEFAKMAREMLEQTGAFKMSKCHPSMTFIFEIVHPNDPHIIPDDVGVYLLGARLKEWATPQHAVEESLLDTWAKHGGMKRPDVYYMRFGDVVKLNQNVDHEGFVCFTDDGKELKLKSPKYLVTKFLARMRPEKFLDAINNDGVKLKSRIDEEYYPLVDHVISNKDQFTSRDEQGRIEMIRSFIMEHQNGV